MGKIDLDLRHLLLSRGEGNNFIALPGTALKNPPLAKQDFKVGTEDVWAVETLMPLFQAGMEDQPGEEKQSRPVHYTFSRMLGNCIHGSTLGAHLTPKPGEHRPLTTILYSTQGDEWQLGRWVEYLNALATLRCAALFDLEKIDRANDEIKRLEQRLTSLNRRLSSADVDERQTARKDAKELFRALTYLERGLPIDFENLTESMKEEDKVLLQYAMEIKGGLAFRTMRSRYYRQEFLDLLPYVDVQPVGRSQPYKEYVDQYFGQSYEFVRMVNLRLTGLRENMEALEGKLQTETALDLQQSAEYAFWQFLFPYYGPQVAFKMLGEAPEIKYSTMTLAIVFGTYMANKGWIRERGGIRGVWRLARIRAIRKSTKLADPARRGVDHLHQGIKQNSTRIKNLTNEKAVAPIRRQLQRVRRWPARNLNRDRG